MDKIENFEMLFNLFTKEKYNVYLEDHEYYKNLTEYFLNNYNNIISSYRSDKDEKYKCFTNRDQDIIRQIIKFNNNKVEISKMSYVAKQFNLSNSRVYQIFDRFYRFLERKYFIELCKKYGIQSSKVSYVYELMDWIKEIEDGNLNKFHSLQENLYNFVIHKKLFDEINNNKNIKIEEDKLTISYHYDENEDDLTMYLISFLPIFYNNLYNSIYITDNTYKCKIIYKENPDKIHINTIGDFIYGYKFRAE